jgi:hypothetical protein
MFRTARFALVLLCSALAGAQDDSLAGSFLSGLLDTITSTADAKDCPGVCVHALATIICYDVLEDVVCPSSSMKCCVEPPAPNSTEKDPSQSTSPPPNQTTSLTTTTVERTTTSTTIAPITNTSNQLASDDKIQQKNSNSTNEQAGTFPPRTCQLRSNMCVCSVGEGLSWSLCGRTNRRLLRGYPDNRRLM